MLRPARCVCAAAEGNLLQKVHLMCLRYLVCLGGILVTKKLGIFLIFIILFNNFYLFF